MIKVELIDVLILLFILYLTYVTFDKDNYKTKVEEIKEKINDIEKRNILTKSPGNEFLLNDVDNLIQEKEVVNNVIEERLDNVDELVNDKQIETKKPYVEASDVNEVNNVEMLVQADNLNTIQKLN